MNEERNDWTIGKLPTLGPDGPVPEAEPRETGTEWQQDAGQTIGEMETIAPEKGPGTMLLAKRYRALRRLGEGGMGSVWLAEDTKLDNRLVAIKMLPAVLAGKKGAYRQVKQEALMAMKLSHPNIATVRAFEEDEGGAPFLVMDYIEGEGLDDILSERGSLGEAETLKILGPVAASLDYAHSQGVVHRDVKPGNVMVRKDGTPFVLDFGIAREIQETMTRVTGKFSSGTLLYMSPEQLRGRAPKAAQDVYSFAAMAYECLAGHPPFYRGAVEDQIKNEAPEELQERVASTGLRKGIMAGLAKVPEERPGSCDGILRGKIIEHNGNRFADNNSPRRLEEETEREQERAALLGGIHCRVSEERESIDASRRRTNMEPAAEKEAAGQTAGVQGETTENAANGMRANAERKPASGKGCLWGIIILAIVGLWALGQYNGLVGRDEECNRAWGNVESVLQRRFDLIPNLVNTVKGYATHEKGTLDEITRLRNQWGEAKTPDEKVAAASRLESALARLLVVVENYPVLKANENFVRLQDELAGTENRINVERQRYNESVQMYNTRVRKMPGALIANFAGFRTRTPFEVVKGAEVAPTVQF